MTIQFAAEEDTGLILRFIKELADYEGMLSEVEATEPLLREWIFEKKKAEVLIGLEGGEPVGFALFFHNFSTFLGRAGIYLEDLYVRPEYRGKGCGTAFLKRLAELAVERGCGRLEWWCLDWNKPSIEFYRAMGAVPMDDWTVYRITGDQLKNLSGHAGNSERSESDGEDERHAYAGQGKNVIQNKGIRGGGERLIGKPCCGHDGSGSRKRV